MSVSQIWKIGHVKINHKGQQQIELRAQGKKIIPKKEENQNKIMSQHTKINADALTKSQRYIYS